MSKKELLFSVTKKDIIFEYFSGTGPGGQKRNKCQNCCRCKHLPSGASGVCKEYKSKDKNTKTAFKRMAESEVFTKWIKLEAARKTGEIQKIEEEVEKQMNNIKIEVKNKNNKWENLNEK